MVSIIIPTLNEEKYLGFLLESIKKQSFKDYEIIIADAGSKDSTLDITRQYGCTVVSGGLPAKARNNGAKAAKSDLLLFLDADVLLPPDFLENSVKQFTEKNLGIAGFLLRPINGKSIDIFAYQVLDIFVRATLGFWRHAATAIMVKKSIHEKNAGFNEAITMVEDYEYAKRASRVSKYGYIRQPVDVSIRRYEKDGRFTYLKYFIAALYTHFFGPIKSDIFKYKFNHYKDI